MPGEQRSLPGRERALPDADPVARYRTQLPKCSWGFRSFARGSSRQILLSVRTRMSDPHDHDPSVGAATPWRSERASPTWASDAPDWIDVHVVEEMYAGMRLDLFLTKRIKRATRSQVARIIRRGVSVDGRVGRAAMRVRTGQRVEIPRHERGDPGAPGLDDVEVLTEDEGVVVVCKPPGMLVHRTAHEATRTVEAFLGARYPGERVEATHRLDRDTSGVLVCGRGLDAIRSLRRAFANHLVDKCYLAVVDDPAHRWSEGQRETFDAPLGFQPDARVALRMGLGDLPCVTRAGCVARTSERALLEVTMEGGRQHQIRTHLALFGTPIAADKLYGMGEAFFTRWLDAPGDAALVAALSTRWHALHAWRVSFTYGGRHHRIEAPTPERLRALLR